MSQNNFQSYPARIYFEQMGHIFPFSQYILPDLILRSYLHIAEFVADEFKRLK